MPQFHLLLFIPSDLSTQYMSESLVHMAPIDTRYSRKKNALLYFQWISLQMYASKDTFLLTANNDHQLIWEKIQ